MNHRAVCSECSWTGDAETLSGAAREADEHRDETGHDAKVERDLATDGGVDQDDGEIDRGSISMESFNDLLTFDGDHANPTTHAAIVRDDNELLIYVGRSRNADSEWETRSYRVVGRRVRFTVGDADRAALAAVLIETFDEDLLTVDSQHMQRTPVRTGVPVCVAVDGKPAVAAWLNVRGESREAIADRMGVSDRTVSEYLSRFRRRGVGIPDGVEPPEIDVTMETVPSRFDPGTSRQQIVADRGEARGE